MQEHKLKRAIRGTIDTALEQCNRRLIKDDQGYRLEKNIFFDEFAVYRAHYKPQDTLTVFDVGAHTGETIAEYRKAFPNATIHAFEPASDNFQTLSSRYAGQDRTHLNNAAVGAEKGEAALFVMGKNVTGNSLVRPSNQDIIQETQKVPVLPLDEYCAENAIDRIDILKIDTQGYERECLEGLHHMLAAGKIGLIKLEVMFHEAYSRKTSFRLLEEILHPHDYFLLDICWIKKSSSKKRTLVVDVVYAHKKSML